MQIYDTIFENNIAKTTSGGAMILGENNDEIKWSRCQFIRNTAAQTGGAITMVSDNKKLSISQTVFEENGAHRGGAVSMLNSIGNCKFEDITFIHNKADVGGALDMVLQAKDITLKSVVFQNNTVYCKF